MDGISKGKIAVLTFDDGPSDQATDRKILEVLAKHHAKSIWFVNCRHLDAQIHPDFQAHRESLILAMRQGHLIGNHTYNYENMVGLDILEPRRAALEVTSCSDMIGSLTGLQPTLFRAPWGALSGRMEKFVSSMGMTSMNWTANSGDTGFANKPEALAKHFFADPSAGFAETIEDGDVILFHSISSTAMFLDRFLTRLENRGFCFVLPSDARTTPGKGGVGTTSLRASL